MTVSSVKCTDVTYKTHSGLLAAQLRWLVDLAALVCKVNCWLSCRVSALQSVVAGSIFSGRDHSIHCWWDLIRFEQLSRISVYRVYVFAGHGNSIHNIIPQLKKGNVDHGNSIHNRHLCFAFQRNYFKGNYFEEDLYNQFYIFIDRRFIMSEK